LPRFSVQRPSRSVCLPRWLPFSRGSAALEGVLLGLDQRRAARLDLRRIDTLTAHRQTAFVTKQQSSASSRAKRRATAPSPPGCSRQSQIVLVPGAVSCSAGPTNRMTDSRSLSRYSVCTSESVYSLCRRRAGTLVPRRRASGRLCSDPSATAPLQPLTTENLKSTTPDSRSNGSPATDSALAAHRPQKSPVVPPSPPPSPVASNRRSTSNASDSKSECQFGVKDRVHSTSMRKPGKESLASCDLVANHGKACDHYPILNRTRSV
jgi:hypothetical protein